VRTLRILLLDDNPLVGQALARLLQPHEIVHLMDPTAALERACSEHFDGLLIDVGMPAVSGPDFVASLKARDPKVAERAVLLTGMTGFDHRTTVPLVRKPLSKNDADRLYWWWSGGEP
jgi:DNA-binding NarL/FixJ family response regulator